MINHVLLLLAFPPDLPKLWNCQDIAANLKVCYVNVSSELVDANAWTFSSMYTLRPYSQGLQEKQHQEGGLT